VLPSNLARGQPASRQEEIPRGADCRFMPNFCGYYHTVDRVRRLGPQSAINRAVFFTVSSYRNGLGGHQWRSPRSRRLGSQRDSICPITDLWPDVISGLPLLVHIPRAVCAPHLFQEILEKEAGTTYVPQVPLIIMHSQSTQSPSNGPNAWGVACRPQACRDNFLVYRMGFFDHFRRGGCGAFAGEWCSADALTRAHAIYRP
jgi:hypothetical protein